MTVTGTTLPCSSKTWVMPTFLPIMPFITIASRGVRWPLAHAGIGPLPQYCCVHALADAVSAYGRTAVRLLELDLDIYTSRQVQAHEGINSLTIRVQHI